MTLPYALTAPQTADQITIQLSYHVLGSRICAVACTRSVCETRRERLPSLLLNLENRCGRTFTVSADNSACFPSFFAFTLSIVHPALLISRFSPWPVVRPINPESITASFHLSHAFNVICVFSYRIEQKVRRSKRLALYEKEVLRSRDALCLSLGLQYQDHMLYGPNGRNKVCGYVIVSCTLHLFHTIHKSLQDVRLPINREWRWNVADIAEILAVSTGGHRWEHTIPP